MHLELTKNRTHTHTLTNINKKERNRLRNAMCAESYNINEYGFRFSISNNIDFQNKP